jgi:hypothetical protein
LSLSFTASDGKVSIKKKLILVFETTKAKTTEKDTIEFKGEKPTVFIKSVSSTGLVEINFDSNMVFGKDHME